MVAGKTNCDNYDVGILGPLGDDRNGSGHRCVKDVLNLPISRGTDAQFGSRR